MMFLIPFVVSCFAIFLAKFTNEEMVRTVALFLAFAGFITSCVLAPWYLQVLILFLVLFSEFFL